MRALSLRTLLVRNLLLALVLGLVAFAVPNARVAATDVELMRIGSAHQVSATQKVIWILAIGSDARPGQPMLRSHGDAIQLIGINPRTGAASAIGVPRDSWVPIPGHGRNKINAGLVYGGPTGMAKAVARLTGITPDYVFVTRFSFFERMIDSIGGIDVDNPRRFSDPYLRKEGFKKGRIHLRGYGAMAFSRIRKSLRFGDFDRSANQQRTLRAIHRKIRANAHRPGFIERGVLTVMQHTSTNLSPAELFTLAQVIARVEPSRITTCVLRGGVGWVGPQSVVFPDVRQARRLGRDARHDATISRC